MFYRLPALHDGEPPIGQQLYLPAKRVLLVPEEQRSGGYWCLILGRFNGSTDTDTHGVFTVDLKYSMVTVNELKPDEYAAAWLARAAKRHYYRQPRRWEVAKHLVTRARVPGSLNISLYPAKVEELCRSMGCRPEGFASLLKRIAHDLREVEAATSRTALGVWRLSLTLSAHASANGNSS